MRIALLPFLLFVTTLLSAQINTVGLVGPAVSGNWEEDLALTQNPDDPKIWFGQVSLFEGEVKFRANQNWAKNWGDTGFPGGKGTQDGANIPVPEGTYIVYINTETGAYHFEYLGPRGSAGKEVDPDAPPIANIEMGGNQIRTGSQVHFLNVCIGSVNRYSWKFEGAYPPASSQANPVVSYDKPGVFDVELIVYNNNGSDTLYLPDHMIVTERNTAVADWWNEAVFYEIFVRSFYDSDGDGIGDFAGMTQKLDYLNDGDPNTYDDLGITGIWLMPIHDSPSYHGYDAVDYRSVHPDFGTMEDFKTFLEEAHKRGIRVIIDYVMNHSSDKHPWFLESASGPDSDKRDWYVWSADTSLYSRDNAWHKHQSGNYYGAFSRGMPDMNYRNDAMKQEMFDIATYWLEDIGVDGFRLDAVKYLVETGSVREHTKETFDFFREFRKHYKSINPEAFSVGEAWTSTDIVLKYVEHEGIDYCFDFDLSFAIGRGFKTGEASYINHQLQESYNVYPHLQYGTFLTNHDQTRIINVLDYDTEKAAAAASIYLTAPGIPYLYYGEEIGQSGQKPDPNIRTPMQWNDDENTGFSSSTPWMMPNATYPEVNVANQLQETGSLLRHYQKLIHIRNKESALKTGDMQSIACASPEVVAFKRSLEGEHILIFINISGNSVPDAALDFSATDLRPGNHRYLDLYGNTKGILEINDQLEATAPNLAPHGTLILKVGSK
ncbi:MAG: hypothetical protein GYB31_19940 [Bacteroidetes bacterium]|nr:hypothetical protein [Bacteroidota bacterium]